ncbi:MAG TPA: histidinol dehydrogenase, partial [Synergistaceae bacterium]|nr:histidinol dehydrogenase [Synergistaceae bacterium]
MARLRHQGWGAVEDLSRSLDHFEGPHRVPVEDLLRSADELPPALRKALLTAEENVRAFCRHQRSLLSDQEWELSPGVRAGVRFLPVRRGAVYVPGGRYPLPSTA